MKRIMMSFAFIAAIGGAIATQSFRQPQATTYYEAKASDKPNSCHLIDCSESGLTNCTFTSGSGADTWYKSIGTQTPCFSVASSLKRP